MAYMAEIINCWLEAPEDRDVCEDCESLGYLWLDTGGEEQKALIKDDGLLRWNKVMVENDLVWLQSKGYRGDIEFFDPTGRRGWKYSLTDAGVEMYESVLHYKEAPEYVIGQEKA